MNYEHDFIGEMVLQEVFEEVIEQVMKYKQIQGLDIPPRYLEKESTAIKQ